MAIYHSRSPTIIMLEADNKLENSSFVLLNLAMALLLQCAEKNPSSSLKVCYNNCKDDGVDHDFHYHRRY